MCLPVWRELKRVLTSAKSTHCGCGSHVPSRLEGIETPADFCYVAPVVVGSHVPSRLEGIETSFVFFSC